MNSTLLSYGLNPAVFAGHRGTPARVTAVHRDRYEVVSEFGATHARLKTSVYLRDVGASPQGPGKVVG